MSYEVTELVPCPRCRMLMSRHCALCRGSQLIMTSLAVDYALRSGFVSSLTAAQLRTLHGYPT